MKRIRVYFSIEFYCLLQNAYTAVQCEHDQCALFQLYLMMCIVPAVLDDAHQVVW